jgi:hypothetical protein
LFAIVSGCTNNLEELFYMWSLGTIKMVRKAISIPIKFCIGMEAFKILGNNVFVVFPKINIMCSSKATPPMM